MPALALFLGSVAVYALVPLLVATRRTSYQFVLFYAHIACVLTVGGLLGTIYVFPIVGDVSLLAGQVSYGGFMFSVFVTAIVGRDVQVVRNLIALSVAVDVVVYLLFRISNEALASHAVPNPLHTAPGVFDQSLRVVVFGGVLIIAELIALLGLCELAKRHHLGRVAMGVVYVASFVGILTADGVLFPSLVLLPPDGLGGFIQSGVKAKLVLAGVYAVPLIVFVTFYRRVLDRFEEAPVPLAQLVSVSRDRLLDQLDEQQSQLDAQRAMLVESTERAGRSTAVVERILDAASTTLIIVTDTERRITRFNRGGQQMLGYSESEVLGRTPAEVFRTDNELIQQTEQLATENVDDMLSDAFAHGRRRDWEYTTRDGRRRTISLSVTPIYDGGRLIGFLGVGEDVSDRVRAEEATAEALQRELAAVARLEEADRVKDELVSTISHELRTPITSIQGYSELIADGSLGELTDAQEGALVKVLRNATRLEVLIDDLLVMAESERGQLALKAEPTDLCEVVRTVHETLGQLGRRKSLDVHLDLPEDEVTVVGDPAALERVVQNLVGNAVKFTPDGGEVVIAVRRLDDDAQLVVRDTGIGISESDQERMFTRFFRASVANERAIPGTGLGLSVVHTLVTQHGGEISVTSALGEGTEISVLLPATPTRPDLG